MLLHRNGLDKVNAYSRDIREALLAAQGQADRRGIITDPRGLPSLWR